MTVHRQGSSRALRWTIGAGVLLASSMVLASNPPAGPPASAVTPALVVKRTKFVYVANADIYHFIPSGDYWVVQVVGIPANDTMASHVSDNGQVIFLRQNEKDGIIERLISESFRKRLQVTPPPPPADPPQ